MAYTVLIIQSDIVTAKANAAGLTSVGCKVLATDSDGKNILSLVKKHRPDALIIDLFLESGTADEIAELLRSSYTEPLAIIAVYHYKCDRLFANFMDCGGDYVLSAALDFPHTAKRIEKTVEFYRRKANLRQNPIRQCVWKYLINISMSLTSNGFIYLQDAVELAIETPALLRDLTHGLYETIARRHNAKGPSIERCIRTTLDEAFTIGDPDILYKLYGPIIHPDSGRPKPGNFIILLTKMVCDDLAIEFRDGM